MCVTEGHAPHTDLLISSGPSDSAHVLLSVSHMLNDMLAHVYGLLHVVEQIETEEKCAWRVAATNGGCESSD